MPSLMGSAADAACRLGRAVCLAAAAAPLPADGATASSGSSSAAVAAPFVSLLGRCMLMVGGGIAAALDSRRPMQATEFSTVPEVLQVLLGCLHWLQTEAACCSLLDAAIVGGGGGTAAELSAGLQQQLMDTAAAPAPSRWFVARLWSRLSGAASSSSTDGHAVAVKLYETGLAAQLQEFGGALCAIVPGVCGNPGCRALTEMSELALVAAVPGKKGCGKCSGCGACSFCSRWDHGG